MPLDSVARLKTGLGPLTVAHLGQLPAVTISFNLAPGVSLGDAVGRVEEMARENLPATIRTSFQGVAAAFQSSLQGMGILLAMAILVIYMVLGILYESFIHPLTILSGLPSAGLGALVTLLVFHDELNIYSFVGIIMLIGIVKKNAIMMIDFALEAQRQHGASPAEAIFEACLVRFRPDHDDDDGRADGHPADRARPGRRRRGAASPGSRGGGRPGRFATADALHHTRILRLHGEAPGLAPEPQESLAPANGNPRRSHRRRPRIDKLRLTPAAFAP